MEFSVFKKLVIARCEELGLSDYELYYQMAESISTETYQHAISEFTASTEGGVCFRCIVGGKMGYASTESLTEEQAKAAAETDKYNLLIWLYGTANGEGRWLKTGTYGNIEYSYYNARLIKPFKELI